MTSVCQVNDTCTNSYVTLRRSSLLASVQPLVTWTTTRTSGPRIIIIPPGMSLVHRGITTTITIHTTITSTQLTMAVVVDCTTTITTSTSRQRLLRWRCSSMTADCACGLTITTAVPGLPRRSMPVSATLDVIQANLK